MKNTVRLGSTVLAQGQCKVCVPIMGTCLKDIEAASAAARAAGADILELRADSMCAMPSIQLAAQMCNAVREGSEGLPLIFTLRTARDGGAGSAHCAAYEALLTALVTEHNGLCDAVDVELSVGEAAFARIASAARGLGAAVIGSSHDFMKTPSCRDICARLAAMQRLGADVCKIAVMPENKLDVLELMRAAVLSEEELAAPIIAIAMGPLGVMTRVCGEAFGSCLTFGTAGKASAPGQIDARRLRSVLEVIHNSI